MPEDGIKLKSIGSLPRIVEVVVVLAPKTVVEVLVVEVVKVVNVGPVPVTSKSTTGDSWPSEFLTFTFIIPT